MYNFGFAEWYGIMFDFFFVLASSYTRPVGLDEPFVKVALQRKACFPDNCLHVLAEVMFIYKPCRECWHACLIFSFNREKM